MDGYLYISYYDQTLSIPQSFEYVKPEDGEPEQLEILEHDLMPNELISSTLYSEPVYEAGVYEVETDSILQYVSAMTGMLDTEVTAEVYLLGNNAKIPTDGILLETVSGTFKYADYHRMTLPNNLSLPKGALISIVVLQRVATLRHPRGLRKHRLRQPAHQGIRLSSLRSGDAPRLQSKSPNCGRRGGDLPRMRLRNPGS